MQDVMVSCDILEKPEATVRFCVHFPCVRASWSVASRSIVGHVPARYLARPAFQLSDALALSENLA
jgi:hypothetical protein